MHYYGIKRNHYDYPFFTGFSSSATAKADDLKWDSWRVALYPNKIEALDVLTSVYEQEPTAQLITIKVEVDGTLED